MSIVEYSAIAFGVILVIGIIVYVLVNRNKGTTKTHESFQTITQVFDRSNVSDVSMKRNKIVVTFQDINAFDPQTLKDAGAKGISIVGDTIKFYIDEDIEVTKVLFVALKDYMEREDV